MRERVLAVFVAAMYVNMCGGVRERERGREREYSSHIIMEAFAVQMH